MLEDFVAQRITAATAEGSLAAHVDASLKARIAGKRKAIEKVRAELPGRLASASVAASKYTEDLGKFEGPARELVEAKLRAESDRLVPAGRQLAETERDRLDLEVADREAEWIGAALRDSALVWRLMAPDNQGLLRARRRRPCERGDQRRRGRAGERRGRRRLERGGMTLDQQQAAPTEDAPKDRHVLTGTLFRRRSSRVTLSETPPPPKPELVRRPANVARMLALAHHLQSAIDRRLVADRAAVVRNLELTRARVTHVLELLLLAPDLHVSALPLEAVDRAEPMNERALRAEAHARSCVEQREPGDPSQTRLKLASSSDTDSSPTARS